MSSAAQPIFLMLIMFGVFYFILIRPQVKKQKQHQEMLSKLEKGDMVITNGGLIGKISGITDTVLTVELQEKVRVRVLRSAVQGKYQPENKRSADKKAA